MYSTRIPFFRGFTAVILLAMAVTTAQAVTGWACWAGGGRVFRAQMSGSEEDLTGNVSATHATWSYDGTLIFYSTSSGALYAMNNDGTGVKKIGTGSGSGISKIAAYRPEAKSLFHANGSSFYKINAETGVSSKVADAGRTIEGEIAISRDGTRIAFRSGGNLYKMTVGGSASQYATYCSAGLSEDGNYLTENQDGHATLKVINWSGGSVTLNAGVIGKWDNQSFAVNSSDWICTLDDDEGSGINDNVGKGVGLVSRSNQAYQVIKGTSQTTQFPRFFVGTLPPVGTPDTTPPTQVTGLDATAQDQTSIQLTWDAASDAESGIKEYNIYRGSSKIATATTSTYTDDGLSEGTEYTYQVSAVNGSDLEGTKSSSASATTLSDQTPPTLVSAGLTGETQLVLTFSEKVTSATATNTANYAISPAISVSAAALDAGQTKVTLTTGTHSTGVTYTVTVSGVKDLKGNTISGSNTDTYQWFEDKVWLLAETGTLGGNMALGTWSGSKGSQVVYADAAGATAAYTVTIPETGTWYAWGRFYFNGSGNDPNSFWFKVDSGTELKFGNNNDYWQQWVWEGDGNIGSGTPGKLNLGILSAGTHTITISDREPSVNCMLDVILLTSDGSYTPEDDDVAVSPVQLSSFLVSSTGEGVVLTWTTQSEQDNLGFNVLRSAEPGSGYEKVNTGLIQGADTISRPQDYRYVDAAPAGTWYYKLEQVDLDGTKNYSEPVTVTVTGTGIVPCAVYVRRIPGRGRVLDITGRTVRGRTGQPGMYLTRDEKGNPVKILLLK